MLFSAPRGLSFFKSFLNLCFGCDFVSHVLKLEVCLLFCYVFCSGKRSLEVQKRRKVNSFEIYI